MLYYFLKLSQNEVKHSQIFAIPPFFDFVPNCCHFWKDGAAHLFVDVMLFLSSQLPTFITTLKLYQNNNINYTEEVAIVLVAPFKLQLVTDGSLCLYNILVNFLWLVSCQELNSL